MRANDLIECERDRRRGQDGFTLLEVLVAVALFALGSIAVIAVRSNSYKEAVATENMNLCRYLLQRKMEEVLLEPDQYSDGDTGEFEEDAFADYTWGVSIEEVELIGGEEEEEDEQGRSREQTRSVDIPRPGDDENQEDLAAEEEQTIVKVYRITVYIYYPEGENEKRFSATTYLPSEAVADDELF